MTLDDSTRFDYSYNEKESSEEEVTTMYQTNAGSGGGGYSLSLVSPPDVYSPSSEVISIQRNINPRFRGVSAEDSPTHRSTRTRREMQSFTGTTVVAKRNARERTRVHTVNKAFTILKQHLPSLRIHSKRVSKLRILKAAIIYINHLTDTVNASKATHTTHSSSHISFADTPITSSIASSTTKTSLDTALPHFKNFIDYAPYIPQAPPTISFQAPQLAASAPVVDEFASILSTAAASIGYSNPWGSHTHSGYV